MLKENSTKILTSILIILVSVATGYLTYNFAGASFPESLILGLFSCILGLLISFYVFIVSQLHGISEKILQQLAGFGKINRSLFGIERMKCQSRWTQRLPIIKLFEENLDQWYASLSEATDRDQKDLWLNVLNLYLLEEGKDLGALRLSTNVDIYVLLLMHTIEYHIECYGREAVIVILTSVLPRDWYEWPSPVGLEQKRVYAYKDALCAYIRKKKAAKVTPDFRRYIILTESNGCFRNKDVLSSEEQQKFIPRYVGELHFEPEKALYVVAEKIARSFPESYRDLLFFGRRAENGIDWRWAVESNMDPGFPVMFVKFYDSKTVKAPAQFAGYDVNTFIGAIEDKSERLPFQTGKNQKCTPLKGKG